MSLTVLSMSVVVAPEAGAAQAGDLIKMDGLSSVYYLGADGKRYVFPNESTYKSWYNDFSGVVTIAQSELESYPLGKNVTVRPGTKLVKITTNPKVYAVEPNGMLLAIPDEATALALYGANWNKRIIDIADSFFTNYDIATGEASATAYPTGSLVKFGADATVYYIADDGTARAIADEAAFLANRFKWDDVITATIAAPTVGTALTGAESGLTDTSSGAGGTAGAGSGMTVAIASDTPDAGNIPAGSPVDFLKVNFTAASDGDVQIQSATVNAYDLGTATYIDSVTWYDDGVKLGTSKNMTSDRVATFNFATPVVVAAGTTKSLTVRATIEAGQSGNYAIGIASASSVITNGASVSGSFPIIGNTKAIVTGTSIGTVTMSAADTTATVDAEFGEDDVLMAGFSLTASNEPAIWECSIFKNGGNNNDELASNFRLLIDGDEVATADAIVDRYVTFDLGSYVIAKNDTVDIEVYGDVGIGNAGDDINLYVDEANDFSFVGQDFGYGIEPSVHANLDADGEGYTINLTASDFTIDMDKAATPSKDVRSGDNDVVLATINMTSNGENATTDYIKENGADRFYISGTGLECNEFENTELRDTDTGVAYDVTVASSTTATYCGLTINEEITFVKGVTRSFELRTDLNATTDTHYPSEDDTYQVTLASGAFSITGDVSDATITAAPAAVTSAIATVKAASLIVQQSTLTAKTIVPGAAEVEVYKAQLEVGASSYVDITSVTVSATGTASVAFDDDNITKLDLYIDGKLVKSKSGSIVESGTAANYITFNSLDTTNRRIAAGDNVDMVVKATFASTFTAGKTGLFELGLGNTSTAIVAKDKDSNDVVETGITANVSSRSVTLATTGTLKVELKVDDTRADENTYILAGAGTAKDRYLGELVFTSANEDIKVTELVLSQEGTANNGDIAMVNLYNEDGEIVASKAPSANGHVYFSTLDYVFSADQATSLFIGVTTKTINADGDSSGTATFADTIKFTLGTTADVNEVGGSAAVKAIGVDSGEDVTLAVASTATVAAGEWANPNLATTTYATITGSVLNSIANTMDAGVLDSIGVQTIGEYKFVFDNGTNRTTANEELKAQMRELQLTFSTSTGVDVVDVQAYIEGNASNKTNAVNPVSGVATIDLTTLDGDTALVDGTVTLVIVGDVTVTGTGTKSLKTKIADLVGAGDFTYNGNHNTPSTYWGDGEGVLLENIVDVQGATLSNSF